MKKKLINPPSQNLQKPMPGPTRNILLRDYSEIETALLGAGSWEKERVARAHNVAPTQGTPFLERSRSIFKTLKLFDSLYRR